MEAPEGKGYPLHCSGLENSVDCTVHGVSKSWTRLRDFHFTKGRSAMNLACASLASSSYRPRRDQHPLSGTW